MKKIILILVGILILFTNKDGIGQSDWYWQSPSPQGNTIKKIFIGGENSIYGIGNFSTIISSSNSGNSWDFVNRFLGLNDNFTTCDRLSEEVFYIGTSNGKILKSIDAGANWHVLSELPGNSSIVVLKFATQSTGYAGNEMNKLFKTINGGSDWIEINSFPDPLISMYVLSELSLFVSTGYEIYGNSKIIHTTDGGNNWTEKTSLTGGQLTILKFLNETTGFAKYYFNLIKTTDGGINWTEVGGVQSYFNNSFIFSEDSIIATYKNFNIYFTTDGGLNWDVKNMPQDICTQLYFESFDKGYALLYSNKIIRTNNRAETWTVLTQANGDGASLGIWLRKVDFVNDLTGYVVGWSRTFKKTTDGGETWQDIQTPLTSHINGVDFIDVNTGYIIGGNSGISHVAKTTDGGNSFNIIHTFNFPNAYKVKFINPNTGFAIGHFHFHRTTDVGESWNFISMPDSVNLQGIDFINESVGVVCGYIRGTSTKKIYRTENAGVNWYEVYSTHENLTNVFFVNELTGYLAGNGVRKTTNGGLEWFKLNALLHNLFLVGIYFLNSSTGFVSGFGDLYRTTNSGDSWEVNTSLPIDTRFDDIKFFNANTGIIIGGFNTILKTYNGGGNFIINVSQLGTEIPESFSLYQNYPNPFNPVTNIKFSLPTTKYTILKVFDITGREVATLVNEKLQAGSYEFTFDANELSSGIYFYQLETDGFVQTRKMVLIK